MSCQTKEPKLKLERSLEGDKWFVEHHAGRHDLMIQETQMKQPVFLHKCDDCTLKISGKVKRIVIDGCSKVSVECDSVLTGLELHNSQRIQVRVNGVLPIATIIKTNRCQLDLSAESMQCEVLASCSSDINISYPKENGDKAHFHIPEQTKTSWDGKQFVTNVDKNS